VIGFCGRDLVFWWLQHEVGTFEWIPGKSFGMVLE